ncbi:MAG: hypothetical protein COB85_08560 [Bacteroidetes bacterium]|nr:MAG: hypothetical protein COB85_08560 [Bacteroidota bacterium]
MAANKKTGAKSGMTRSFLEVLNGNFLTRESAIKHLPFMLFLTLLVLSYIGNAHYAEKTLRESEKLKRNLKELRSAYITAKFDLMFKSRQSEIARAVENMGLKESITPPRKISIIKDDV